MDPSWRPKKGSSGRRKGSTNRKKTTNAAKDQRRIDDVLQIPLSQQVPSQPDPVVTAPIVSTIPKNKKQAAPTTRTRDNPFPLHVPPSDLEPISYGVNITKTDDDVPQSCLTRCGQLSDKLFIRGFFALERGAQKSHLHVQGITLLLMIISLYHSIETRKYTRLRLIIITLVQCA